MRIVVIGGVAGGMSAAARARRLAENAEIIVLDRGDYASFANCGLPYYLSAEITDVADLLIQTPASLAAALNLDVRLRHDVTALNPNTKTLTIQTDSGVQQLTYDHLILSPGARAARPPIAGLDHDRVRPLRTINDVEYLSNLLDDGASRAVVLGSGFIGLEAACSLQELGKKVTVLEYGPRLIGRAVGAETADFFLEQHRDRGIDIQLGARMTRFSGEGGRVSGVELEDGTLIPAQLVIVGIGVLPNTELAEQLDLVVDNGIVVDEHAVASDGTTIAIGDVANIPNPIPGSPTGERIRLESVNNAIEHAKIAAYSLVGQPEAYSGIPWFWSNQGDLKLQIAGLTLGYDQTLIRRDDAKKKFSVLYYRKGQIIAADCVNSPLDFMAVRGALSKGQNIPAAQAHDMNIPLKKLAVDLEVAS